MSSNVSLSVQPQPVFMSAAAPPIEDSSVEMQVNSCALVRFAYENTGVHWASVNRWNVVEMLFTGGLAGAGALTGSLASTCFPESLTMQFVCIAFGAVQSCVANGSSTAAVMSGLEIDREVQNLRREVNILNDQLKSQSERLDQLIASLPPAQIQISELENEIYN